MFDEPMSVFEFYWFQLMLTAIYKPWDLGNALFELAGGFFVAASIRKLYRDKRVAGISWAHVGFFTAWSWWNIYFYAKALQWLSLYGAYGLLVTNTAYLVLLVYYTGRPGGRAR